MAIGAFPIFKLGVLALRQISKPLVNHLKNRAKDSHFFRTKICMPPAQIYHWYEVNVKTSMLGLGKPKEVAKLNEQAAIELGAEMIGEITMFLIAAGAIVAEYGRQSRKYAIEKAAEDMRWSQMEAKVLEIKLKLEETESKQENRLRELEGKLEEKTKK